MYNKINIKINQMKSIFINHNLIKTYKKGMGKVINYFYRKALQFKCIKDMMYINMTMISKNRTIKKRMKN